MTLSRLAGIDSSQSAHSPNSPRSSRSRAASISFSLAEIHSVLAQSHELVMHQRGLILRCHANRQGQYLEWPRVSRCNANTFRHERRTVIRRLILLHYFGCHSMHLRASFAPLQAVIQLRIPLVNPFAIVCPHRIAAQKLPALRLFRQLLTAWLGLDIHNAILRGGQSIALFNIESTTIGGSNGNRRSGTS